MLRGWINGARSRPSGCLTSRLEIDGGLFASVLLDLVGDFLAFMQTVEPGTLHRADMDEYVLAAEGPWSVYFNGAYGSGIVVLTSIRMSCSSIQQVRGSTTNELRSSGWEPHQGRDPGALLPSSGDFYGEVDAHTKNPADFVRPNASVSGLLVLYLELFIKHWNVV